VGRPRTFDQEKALEAAADCFCSRGYEATSVRELSDSMGIGGASLYNAYGDKRALFDAALDHYCNGSMRERMARLEQRTSGLEAIEGFFADVIEKSLKDRDRKGCLLVNSAMEMAPHDAKLAARISSYFSELRGFFVRNIATGQARHEIAPAANADFYSAHLLSVLMGIRVLARFNPDRAFLEAAAGASLRALRHLPNHERKDPS
jgi:TetR/AcrR family transcriptional regulator, transcriptional repressor for nem operon